MNKNQFYYTILITVFMCVFVQRAQAQDYSNTNLHVIYIDHETSTPVTQLCSRIRTLRDDALEIEDALIVYLADGSTPLISLTNLPDETGRDRDKSDAIYAIFDALQTVNSHNVIAREDRRQLLQLFDEFNFVDNNNQLRFKNVTIDFYIGPSFWALGYEKIISHLYVALGVSQFPRDRFAFNIFKPRGTDLGYPKGKPFGNENIDGINEKLTILEY